jgi:antitoxin YefM
MYDKINLLVNLAIFDYFQAVLETFSIFCDRDFSQKLQESIAQAELGETITWEEVKAKLGI